MRKLLAVLFSIAMICTLLFGCTGTVSEAPAADVAAMTAVPPEETASETAEAEQPSPAPEEPAMDTSYPNKTRIIITTDGECDDFNSLHHILLYANDFDFAGIVYSASCFHFQGDGEHMLGEVTEKFLCVGENPDSLTEYRPQEMGWIEETISERYAADYEYLVQNDPEYPSPEKLLYVVKVGNVAFEGDVREATEGSDWIAKCIMDDDERPLYIMSWGGFNTVARALLSLYETYGNTADWDAVYEKIIRKTVIQGTAQDTTYKQHIAELYPDLKMVNGVSNGYGFHYPSKSNGPVHAEKYFMSEWLSENIKFNHGKLMEAYHLVGDGAYYEGELDVYQFGQTTELGSDPNNLAHYNQYDWIGEGDSGLWILHIPVGLRGMENGNYGTWGGRLSLNGVKQNASKDYAEFNFYTGEPDKAFSATRWLQALSEDWAARNDWTVNAYADCNHPPVVSAEELDITGKAGETVTLTGMAEDPDGNALILKWWVYREACEYAGAADELIVSDDASLVTSFMIPADAVSGEYFNIILEVTDDAAAPMTRYAQVIVTVA